MNRMEAIAWVLSVCSYLRLSQAKTLSELVAASLFVGRVSLSAIGRCLSGDTTAKSRIQKTGDVPALLGGWKSGGSLPLNLVRSSRGSLVL